MYTHASKDYICPVCLGVQGIENDKTLILQQDIVYQDESTTAFINSFWIKNNPGHVIVVPNKHHENIYDLPDELGAHIFAVARQIATAMRETYNCEGVTTLQNNEPAGNQHALHYHFHIFPRYTNDTLHTNMTDKKLADPTKRKEYADKLRPLLQISPLNLPY